jgi:hypothetical protein
MVGFAPMFPVVDSAVLPSTGDPPGIFARATADEPIERLTFLLPGLTYLAWQPVRVDDRHRTASAGGGFELSIARWITGGMYVGAVGHVERLDRWRSALGVEAGYQLIGLELSVARDFVERDGPRAQFALQVAPYASVGMIYVSPRWVIALDRRSARDTPGDGAMLVIGLKLPIKIGGK